MCHRMTPLLLEELEEALVNLSFTGHARMPTHSASLARPDVYPGQQMPLVIPSQQGDLRASELTWGFMGYGKSKLVFNTRIETALDQAKTGYGMWSKPILEGRCLVPVRAFYESWTKAPPRRGVEARFTLPRHRVFLLAGVYANDRFSVVTTQPNADVGRIHSRMPLVLGPGESRIWLGTSFAELADRSGIRLETQL